MTVIYNVALGSGTSSAALLTGGTNSIRYGILFGPASALLGQKIRTFKVNLKKTGTPSGNITCTIYDSTSTLIATAVEIVDSTTLPLTFTNYTWTFTSTRTIASNDRLVIEYNGASRIDIEIYATDQYDTSNTLRTRWNGTAWVNGATEDVAATIDDGIFARQLPLEITTITESLNRTITNARVIPEIITISENLATLYTPAQSLPSQPSQGGKGRKPTSKYRDYIRRLAHDLRGVFRTKEKERKSELEQEEEEVKIPAPEPPKKVTILSGPPTAETKLKTINDKWSIVASIPPPETRTEIIYPYPVIINPPQSPLIQTTVAFPPRTAIRQQQSDIPTYRVGEGRHIDSQFIGMRRPKNRAKTASTLNTLMILLDIESRI